MGPTVNGSDRHLLSIFSAALGRDPTGERAAYLDEACAGAPDLRDRVEALLRAHGQAGRFLEPDGSAATVDHSGWESVPPAPRVAGVPTGEGVGTVIAGRYTL